MHVAADFGLSDEESLITNFFTLKPTDLVSCPLATGSITAPLLGAIDGGIDHKFTMKQVVADTDPYSHCTSGTSPAILPCDRFIVDFKVQTTSVTPVKPLSSFNHMRPPAACSE